jgi:hypothetical protein
MDEPKEEKIEIACGFCQTCPLNLASIAKEMPALPGAPIPIVQIFFCRDCHALINVQIVGMRQPTIMGATQAPSQVQTQERQITLK